MRPLGLSQAKWRVLLNISKHKGALNQTHLAECIGVETPTLVRLLDRLEKDGWVKRLDSPADRRVKIVKLGPKAGTVMKVINKTSLDTRKEITSSVSAAEMKKLVSILAKISHKLEKMRNG
ncbi:MAG: MarR family transcriptional regulator [Nitrospinae bacterium]|nr:MarR family transcriptional regulator [Nitrospinota bacterium]